MNLLLRTKLFSGILLLFFCRHGLAQPGKDGTLTLTAGNYVLNRYAVVIANIPSGASIFSVLPGPSFSLCPGDLIMIYQAQGATITTTNNATYGNINAYNSAGFYEFRY